MLALLPVLAVIALAAAPGGIEGQVSKTWDQLTDANARTPANTPDRLTATSSVRARYWAEALDVHATEPWLGTGAGAYATVRTRFRDDALAVRHAHGYVVQTLADLGWAGLAASLIAAIAWLAAAARATGLHRRARGLPYDAERVGMLTLFVVVIVFGVHSAVDWTWFVPANTGVAMLAAGWVVGRGPLRARLEHPEGPAPPPPTWPHASRLQRFANSVPPLHGLAAALVLVIALAAAWTAFQPVRAVHAGDAAFDRLDAGQPEAAASIAEIADRAQPAVRRPAVRARGDRAGPRPQHGGPGRARARGPPRARQRRGVAAARPAAPGGARRPEGRAQRVPRRVLPRPEGAPVHLGHHRGEPRRRYRRAARAVRPMRRSGAPPHGRTCTSSNPA